MPRLSTKNYNPRATGSLRYFKCLVPISVKQLLTLHLQHTLIPVEDFTGPTIAEIQKFLEICDRSRRDGEVNAKTLEYRTGRKRFVYIFFQASSGIRMDQNKGFLPVLYSMADVKYILET